MKKLACEFVGTFILVLIACGVAVATDVHYLGTALNQLWVFILAPLVVHYWHHYYINTFEHKQKLWVTFTSKISHNISFLPVHKHR